MTGPHGDVTHAEPGQVLGVMVMVVMVAMMSRSSERRASKHYQEKSGGENLFHGTNVARFAKAGKTHLWAASKKET
jgi:hypothetical protein